MTSVNATIAASSVLRTPGQNQQTRPEQVRPVDSAVDRDVQRTEDQSDESRQNSQQSQSVTRADNETSASNARQEPVEAPGEQQVLAQQAAEQAEFSQRQSQVDDDNTDPEPVSASESDSEPVQNSSEPDRSSQASQATRNEDAGLVNQQQRFSAETELFSTIQSFGQANQRPEQGGEVSIVV